MQADCETKDSTIANETSQEVKLESSLETEEEQMEKATRNYSKVPNNLRKVLIDRVLTNGESIYEASLQLGIKYSTAKSIVKIFRSEGRIDAIDPNEMKKLKAKKRLKKGLETTPEQVNSLNGNLGFWERNQRSLESRPKTRLATGSVDRPSYYQIEEEIALNERIELELEKEQVNETSIRRSTRSQSKKRDQDESIEFPKSVPYKLQKTKSSSKVMVEIKQEYAIKQENQEQEKSNNDFASSEVKLEGDTRTDFQEKTEGIFAYESAAEKVIPRADFKNEENQGQAPKFIDRSDPRVMLNALLSNTNGILPNLSLPNSAPALQESIHKYPNPYLNSFDRNMALQRTFEVIRYQNYIQAQMRYARAGLLPVASLIPGFTSNIPGAGAAENKKQGF